MTRSSAIRNDHTPLTQVRTAGGPVEEDDQQEADEAHGAEGDVQSGARALPQRSRHRSGSNGLSETETDSNFISQLYINHKIYSNEENSTGLLALDPNARDGVFNRLHNLSDLQ